MKNLNTTGTFGQYIQSIAVEIDRLLDQPDRMVEISETDWDAGRRNLLPALVIHFAGTYFSIAEIEFEQNQHRSDRLNNLAEVRFQSAIEDLKDMAEGPNRLIERLTAPEPESKKMMLHEAREYLNTIATEINETIGEKILGEFLSRYAQPMVLGSHIDIVAEVNIDSKEAIGHRARGIMIDRTIRAHIQMIALLEQNKAKLEVL